MPKSVSARKNKNFYFNNEIVMRSSMIMMIFRRINVVRYIAIVSEKLTIIRHIVARHMTSFLNQKF